MTNASKDSVATSAKLWVIIWVVNNIILLLLNKAAFAKVDFKYPFFLSFVHMVCNFSGALMTLSCKDRFASLMGEITTQKLDKSGQRTIVAFSVIFMLNIGIGNVSLRYVSLNFNQVMRSAVPAVTMAMGLAMRKSFSTRRQLSILPVVAGVAMSCYGDMSYTTIGLVFTLFCVLLAALKVVAAGEMLTGSLKLHPVDLLRNMAPLAMIQFLILSFATGEISSIASRWEAEFNPMVNASPMCIVLVSGLLSYTLNISSFMANKLTSPLTLCVVSNVKQVLTILFGTMLFGTEITVMNGGGIAVVLLGSAYYSYVCTIERLQPSTAPATNGSKDVEEGVSLMEKIGK